MIFSFFKKSNENMNEEISMSFRGRCLSVYLWPLLCIFTR